jgi:hypothetical protein
MSIHTYIHTVSVLVRLAPDGVSEAHFGQPVEIAASPALQIPLQPTRLRVRSSLQWWPMAERMASDIVHSLAANTRRRPADDAAMLQSTPACTLHTSFDFSRPGSISQTLLRLEEHTGMSAPVQLVTINSAYHQINGVPQLWQPTLFCFG